jgi:GNAT superfamily N-acetyltransferase
MSSQDFCLTTDKSRLDIAEIHRFLTEESYWAAGRTLEQTRMAIENSICFAIFSGDEMAAFGRVVSDKATFAYVGDVFVKEPFRGHGLSKMLMQAMISHPELQGLRRWILATRDAHGLYEKFGFSELRFPERWMERPAPNAY